MHSRKIWHRQLHLERAMPSPLGTLIGFQPDLCKRFVAAFLHPWPEKRPPRPFRALLQKHSICRTLPRKTLSSSSDVLPFNVVVHVLCGNSNIVLLARWLSAYLPILYLPYGNLPSCRLFKSHTHCQLCISPLHMHSTHPTHRRQPFTY